MERRRLHRRCQGVRRLGRPDVDHGALNDRHDFNDLNNDVADHHDQFGAHDYHHLSPLQYNHGAPNDDDGARNDNNYRGPADHNQRAPGGHYDHKRGTAQ